MYRENIYDVIKATGEDVSALVVPKNTGLNGYARNVLKEAGLDLESAKKVGETTLMAGNLAILLGRGEDIPRIVEDESLKSRVVLGVTGDDLLDEYRLRNPENKLKIENTYDWDDEAAIFKRPTLCLMNKTGNIEDVPLEARVAINGKYEYTSRNYMQTSPLFDGKLPSVIVYSGDLERTVYRETNDCCIDAVYSGKTMERYGLKIVQKIRFSDLVVISPLKKEESQIGRAVNKEYSLITGRKKNPTGSYTSEMLQNPEMIARKFNEEAYELIQSFYGRGDVAGEAADVIYALMLMLINKGVTLNELAKELAKRQK